MDKNLANEGGIFRDPCGSWIGGTLLRTCSVIEAELWAHSTIGYDGYPLAHKSPE